MELFIILGVLFLAGMVALTAGIFRVFFHALGCLLVLPVLFVAVVLLGALSGVLVVPALFLLGVVFVVVGLIKLIA